MTTEEKAKAYDEALEQAKKELKVCGSLDCDAARQIFRFFPQLRESEDEKIRKALIWHLKADVDFVSNGVTKAECIAYLEKQKELPFVKDVMLGYPGLYFYDGERMHFRGSPAMEETQKEEKPSFKQISDSVIWDSGLRTGIELGKEEQKSEQYDIDVLEKHITKDSISELAHTVIVRNGWEIVEKEQKPISFNEPYNPDDYEVIMEGNATSLKRKEEKPIDNGTREKIISRATSEKQVVLVSESSGKAEIGWDTRSLEDAKKLLEYGLAFINKQLSTKPTDLLDTMLSKDPHLPKQAVKCEQKPVEIDEYKIIKKHITEDSLSSEVNKRLKECGWYVTDEKPVECSYDNKIQYDSIKSGIEAFASTYSFNIESKLFPQLTKEQQQLWREEIEQAVIAGGESGIELSRDNRYKENRTIEWSEEDERMRNQLIYDIERHKKDGLISAKQNKATKALYNGIEKCYDEKIAWLKSLHPHPKQEWSEEEENELANIISIIEDEKADAVKQYPKYKALHNAYDKRLRFLKSLRPSWKPSEEEIEAVRYFVNKHQSEAWAATGQWKQFTALRGLLGNLEKLM